MGLYGGLKAIPVCYFKGIYLDRRTTMKNILLGIIAINLTFISFNLAMRSVEPVQASDHVQKIAICNPNGYECAKIRSGRLDTG